MKRITVTILTFNEEARIGQCLDSLAGVADEVVVVDSGSTDRTVEICLAHGCRVKVRPLTGYGAQRQYATSLATNPYVLSLDADEALSPALAEEIMRLKEEGFAHRVYTAPRLNFYCGRPVRHCGWYPDRQLRLFDRRYANWSLSDVEEKVVVPDSVSPYPLKGDILHYRCSSPADFCEKERHHAMIRARILAAENPGGISAFKACEEAVREFFDCLIGHSGIADGQIGLRISMERMRCAYLAYNVARKSLKSESNPHTLTT